MNEEQRLGKQGNTNEASEKDVKSLNGKSKDYSKYFDFSNAKVISEEGNKKVIRIEGREISILDQPDYKQGKRRGKEDVQVIRPDTLIPDDMKTIGQGKKFLIRTYGCQMNVHDSENMTGLLLEMGFSETEDTTEADVILLNTCAIRENAENKVFGEIGHLKTLKQEKPELILGICGCMSQEENVVNRIMKKHQHMDLIFGTHNIHRLPHLLKEAIFGKEMVIEVWSKEGDIIENMPRARKGKTQAWVNIMYGCDKFCTYCIVPYTRGKERSRRPEDIIAEVRDLARQGYQEVTLLGQNVNAYGKDFDDIDYGLGHLMDEIHKIDIPRVRFTTSHPRDFDDHLIEVLAKGGNLVEHIHLPVQHGNSQILKLMARKYTRERYIELANKIKNTIPNASFTTDIIVGFPNETEEQFEDTLSLMREIEFDSAFTYIYSPREGTPAAKMKDNVPDKVKRERLARLNALVNEISAKKNLEYQGKVVEVLVEGESKKNPEVLAGRTRTNRLVNFRGPKSAIGTIVYVKINDAKTWSLNGELVESAEVIK
ncbi:(dimethylallyl)adenosine tRNA methylthiotransferase [Alkalihalobacillus alcalophilus ATCC 27647 = CGMCC 1.3604]|uniref:tRNA-2-methylthio-N(6)-dimethylallyladenosine synthase n=1 Tax=Alkalihalobacillus alcalophilus ATCC 27647 = CGMCC 1.3604 TaxID=1218173 RepID=A0A094WNU6_ALKAL|nr:tRNA (N6-isopentenyl adenosine(37)-C2)-methylthiotransferase MiaB [Alkalihalobacillus alcalophilus]KGA98521.1 dimethylallyladenosine tRNA methylthiotransferase [Alkalihalobacillus alcalophilus ATCC 27647 = CGMCC 1.3604]MED1562671.1 tRNA (N6-isopentenyl adenosine(37)-C2)-methylthiotransferase MiaB [Alkalihalobacillus alcalophilus]THG91700.1 (dimethylallyl)adenosine tRNA methylthiotransferase [Alkalihalobacillus alcalophilus ATCC 27647 = CGMCC 1.3604]